MDGEQQYAQPEGGGMTEPATDDILKFPAIDPSDSASLIADQDLGNFKFERDDWTMFRSLGTLSQKAGVPSELLRRLVIKELVDNALDAGGRVSLREESGSYIIEDDGPGIPSEAIARLFSINRPMVSSKLWRMPSRGALGNGLRVVAGAVLASRGDLIVTSRGFRHVVRPQDDGATLVDSIPAIASTGTRIELTLGPDMPADAAALTWGRAAIKMAQGSSYAGKPSPFWWDGDHFFEILQASGTRPVREIIEQLDGCSGARAGTICRDFRSTPATAMSRDDAIALLIVARSQARPVKAARLGSVGPDAFPDRTYTHSEGLVQIGFGNPKASIPFVVEAWAAADKDRDDSQVEIFTNKTPVTGKIIAWQNKNELHLRGCGLCHRFKSERGARLAINIIAPYIPITTDGKEPDLAPFVVDIADAISKAISKAKRALPKSPVRKSQKQIVTDHLDEAVAKASGDGAYRFTVRQLFYALRPFLIEEAGAEPQYGNFEGIISDLENQQGAIPGLTRDPRGTLHHPHLGVDIPVGTLSVERYNRPDWTFNKVLFIEKEGFFEALKAARWPERHDCALLTSKGYGTRAVRDLIDGLAEDAEPITVFCVHDADAAGGMIYQSLQEETRARGRRKLEIINLGLDPWEARSLGLESESVKRDSNRRAPVARYVADRLDGEDWPAWLQKNRYELNAMTMPQFIAWLDAKMLEHCVGKVVPPGDVVVDALRDATESLIRNSITEEILAEAGIDDLVSAAMEDVDLPQVGEVEDDVVVWLQSNPTDPWGGWVDEIAEQLAA